jgi:hypothetical protein
MRVALSVMVTLRFWAKQVDVDVEGVDRPADADQ